MKLCLLLIVVCLGVLPEAIGQADAPDGAKLYKKHCKICHGKTGERTTKTVPVLIQSAKSREERISLVKNGKGKDMPSFSKKMNDAQINAVLDYVLTLPEAGIKK